MKIRVIDNIEELKLHRNEWERILRENGNDIPYIEPDWVLNWWDFFGEKHKMFVLLLGTERGVAGFCPLMLTKKGLYTEINFIGYRLAPFMDFIINDEDREESIQCVVNFLLNMGGRFIVDLHGMFEDSSNFIILNNCLKKRGIPHHLGTTECYFIDINKGGFEDYFLKRFKRLPGHRMAKMEKRIGRLGELVFEINDVNNLDEVFALHDKRWLRMIGSSEFSKGRTKEFFRRLASIQSPYLSTFVNTIRLNGRLIAFKYNFECNGRVTSYRIAHDDDFGILGPGQILIRETIRACFNNGIRIFDFGEGYEPYKKDWTDNSVKLMTLVFPAGTKNARFFFTRYRFVSRLKETLKRNWKIVHFKRHTLGRLKYCLSKEYVLDRLGRIKNAIGREGMYSALKGTAGKIFGNLYAAGEYSILCRELKGRPPAFPESDYPIREATIGDLNRLADFTGWKPKTIVSKLLNGYRYVIAEDNGKIIHCAWVNFTLLEIPCKSFRKEIKAGSAFLDGMPTDRHYRDRGVDISAICYILTRLYKEGYMKCYTAVNVKETKRLGVLHQMGFEEKERIKIRRFLKHMSFNVMQK